MKLSTYKSFLTYKRTMLVASIGKCGYEGYREIQIQRFNGAWTWDITNGYKVVASGVSHNPNLKSVVNILEGKAKTVFHS